MAWIAKPAVAEREDGKRATRERAFLRGCGRHERADADHDERVLDREDVGEEPCSAAGVVAVEVERDVGEHLKADQRRRREDGSWRPCGVAAAGQGGGRGARKRLEIGHVEEVLAEASQCGQRGLDEAVAVGEPRLDELTVLEEASGALAEAPAETSRRSVTDCIVHALRRLEPRAGDSTLRDEEKEQPWERPGDREHDEARATSSWAVPTRASNPKVTSAIGSAEIGRVASTQPVASPARSASPRPRASGLGSTRGSIGLARTCRARTAHASAMVTPSAAAPWLIVSAVWVAKRRAEEREERRTSRDWLCEIRRRLFRQRACEVIGRGDEAESEQWPDDHRRAEHEAEREQERVARRKDAAERRHVGAGLAMEKEAAAEAGAGSFRRRPREVAVRERTTLKEVGRRVDDARPAAEVDGDVRDREQTGRDAEDGEEAPSLRARASSSVVLEAEEERASPTKHRRDDEQRGEHQRRLGGEIGGRDQVPRSEIAFFAQCHCVIHRW